MNIFEVRIARLQERIADRQRMLDACNHIPGQRTAHLIALDAYRDALLIMTTEEVTNAPKQEQPPKEVR